MIVNHSSKKYKKIIAIIILMLILILSILFFSHLPHSTNKTISNPQPHPSAASSSTTSTNTTSPSNNANNKVQSGSDESPSPKKIEGDNKSSVDMEITYIDQLPDMLQINTLIKTVTNNGDCTLNMTGPDNKSYSEKVGVQAMPSTSTCKGFSIPISSLSTGNWKISISFINNDLSASTSKEIIIK